MAKERAVKTSVAIDFKLRNVCGQQQRRRDNASSATSSPSTASFSWSKDEYAVTDLDHERFKLNPIVSGVSLSCLFGSLEMLGVRSEPYSEMVTFSGGHEASPSKPFYGAVSLSTVGTGTLVPKWVPDSVSGLTFSFPSSYGSPIESPTDCQQMMDTLSSTATVVTGHWDDGPVSFWYDELENKIYASHDCWQTVLIEGNTGWMSVEYEYPNNRLIHGPNGYPYKHDVLMAEATDTIYVADGSGGWQPQSRYRNGTTTVGLLAISQRTELYRVVSTYLVDSKKKYEMPAGWPSDNTYPSGEQGPSKDTKKTASMLRTHEICYLMLDGTTHVDRFYFPPLYPYQGSTTYKPKYVYSEANLSQDLQDIVAALQIDLEAMRNKLTFVYPGIDLTGGN